NRSGPEIDYFRTFVERGQPALDVACGTGRILIPLLQAGLDADGCDISPDMLALPRGGRTRGPRPDPVRAGHASARPSPQVSDDPRLWRLRPRVDPRAGPRGASPVPRPPRARWSAAPGQRGSVRRHAPLALLGEGAAGAAPGAVAAAPSTTDRLGRRRVRA